MGLSPRVRGNRTIALLWGPTRGAIPASAGEPANFMMIPSGPQGYPRECGGTHQGGHQQQRAPGLSPRVRGNPGRSSLDHQLEGAIPASAGEPTGRRNPSCRRRGYPRECGGTDRAVGAGQVAAGLSPRVRGNPARHPGVEIGHGAIPASAGEPDSFRQPDASRRGYPRECGGTQRRPPFAAGSGGLSPRVRGNPPCRSPTPHGTGAIPASAGEPPRVRMRSWPAWGYPRECGGTQVLLDLPSTVEGLSPRVRGNRSRPTPAVSSRRAIPASAGEPAGDPAPPHAAAGYPRECGGTPANRTDLRQLRGLSPRVRGNPIYTAAAALQDGAIPASAGEPSGDSERRGTPRGYPRECGGTTGQFQLHYRGEGLSPRVRGNPSDRRLPRVLERAIPASAGEPPGDPGRARGPGGYPRECGGTAIRPSKDRSVTGLSPRVRGNPRQQPRGVPQERAIPASAGEP